MRVKPLIYPKHIVVGNDAYASARMVSVGEGKWGGGLELMRWWMRWAVGLVLDRVSRKLM